MAIAETPVLIFDGECGLCSTSVRWLRRQWRDGEAPTLLAARTVTDEQLRHWSLTRDDLAAAAWWVEPDHLWRGHLAIARALSRCRGGFAVVGRWGARRPGRWLGALAYPVVVRTRHLVARRAAACDRPDASVVR